MRLDRRCSKEVGDLGMRHPSDDHDVFEHAQLDGDLLELVVVHLPDDQHLHIGKLLDDVRQGANQRHATADRDDVAEATGSPVSRRVQALTDRLPIARSRTRRHATSPG